MLIRLQRIAAFARRTIPLGIAVAFLVLTTVKAFVDFDPAWDSVAYHLPFAALRVGLLDAKQFQLTGMLSYYFDGFPSVGSYLKGWLWLLFGRPEAPNLLSVAGLISLVAYVRSVYRLPFAWTVIGLASIPVVLVSAARNQIDLPANAFTTIVVLSICDWLLNPTRFGWKRLLIAFAAAFFATNLKAQMIIPIASAGLLALVAAVFSWWHRSELTEKLRARPKSILALMALGTVLVFSGALRNLITHNNPLYPMELTIGGRVVFAGPIGTAGLWPDPLYSKHYVQGWRWVLSVLEYRAFDFRRIPYTLGNGDVPTGAMSMRVGGYMGLAVLFSLGLFALTVWVRRDKMAWTFATALLLITVLAAFPPGSQEIRYAAYWMMFLVLANLIMLANWTGLEQYSKLYKLFLVCELTYVCLITGGEHIIPQFRPISYYDRQFHVNTTLETTVHGGETICLSSDPQLAIYFAPVFHRSIARDRPYFVRSEGFSRMEKDYRSQGSTVCTWLSPGGI